jgi:hypothetical protein
MTFGHAIVEGIICVGFFAVLVSQGPGITHDGTLPRRKKKNKNQRKRKFESTPNEDLRASTRRRADPVVRRPSLDNEAITVVRAQPSPRPVVRAQPSPRHTPTMTIPLTFPKTLRSDDVLRIDTSLKDRQTLFVEPDDGGPIYGGPRNTSSQIYIVRHLASSHAVQKLEYALIYLPTLFPLREVRYYTPHKDHEDDFFIVINKEDSLLPLAWRFPFDRLREYTASSASEDAN